jgi:hypothetical protein
MALADDLSLRRIAVPGDWKQVVMDIEKGNVGQYVFFLRVSMLSSSEKSTCTEEILKL